MTEWTPELTRASKFLSLVLRHRPEAAGVELDANGWADIDALLAGADGLTRELLERVVATNPKQRFAIDESGTRIRAVQGHSVDVETARVVGARRGRPVILAVDAAGLHAGGAPFWQATNGVWLCEAVPPSRLTVVEP